MVKIKRVMRLIPLPGTLRKPPAVRKNCTAILPCKLSQAESLTIMVNILYA